MAKIFIPIIEKKIGFSFHSCSISCLGKSVENQRAVQQQSKENCHLCKEMKRRNLAVYIRSKSRSDSCHEGIHEEEEENDIMYNERKVADADQNKSAKSSCSAEKS